ncbi:MAG: hypothetical protein ACQESX_03250 [Bacteroidota bacterium]
MQKSAEHSIKENLARYIRKYYRNEILKGSIISSGFLIIMALLIILPEWFLFNPGNVRMVFLIVFMIAAALILSVFVIKPLMKLLKFRNGLSYEQAAILIGKHFPEINDKLLNLLQLEKQHGAYQDDSLIKASIAQKAQDLSPFDFKSGITYKANLPYLWKIAPLLILFGILFLAFPSQFQSSAHRIVNFDKDFEKPKPFQFMLLNDSLVSEENAEFQIMAKTEGKYIPEKVYLNYGDERFLMNRKNNSFQYKIPNVRENTNFYFESDKVRSKEFLLKVHALPVIIDFDMVLDFPDYTGMINDTIDNTGDIVIPEGTNVNWKFYTKDANDLFIHLKDSTRKLNIEENNTATFSDSFKTNEEYLVYAENKYLTGKDTLDYFINIIEDQYPEIEVQEAEDTLQYFRKFFTGVIADDYGFSNLKFFIETDDSVLVEKSLDINQNNKQQFFNSFDFADLAIDKRVRYYFKVIDNDAVNGPKSTTSNVKTFRYPTAKEIQAEKQKQNSSLKSGFEKQNQDSEQLQERIKKLRENMLDREQAGWEEQDELKNLAEEFENLKEKQEELKDDLEKNREYEEELSDTDKKLLDKQKELEELLDKVLDEEMKEMMEEIRELMEKLSEENFDKTMKKMEENAEQMQQQLDRSLELFKQLEFQKDLDDLIQEAEQTEKQQKDLREKVEDQQRKELEKNVPEQGDLQKQLDSLRKESESLKEKNENLEKPNNYEVPEKELNEGDQNMEESIEQMQKRNKNKSMDKMKDAEESLESLKMNLQMQQQQMEEENLAEDAENLKQILQNLIRLSYDQESLMENFQSINRNDPLYVEKIQEQFRIEQKTGIVKDSLIALSKRQAMIEPFVMEELKKIEDNTEKAIESLNERNVSTGVSRQQYAMMHMNNLALMLSEALKNMQSQMNAQGSGKGQPKPGQGVPKMSEIKKMQQKMQQELEQMQEGEGKPKPGEGKSKMNEKLARMAAKQAEIRRKLQKYRQELMKQGEGDQGLSETIKKMEENETDLVNKRITEEMIKRQQDIVTRLLESEKAERKQEQEERREGKTAEDWERTNPAALEFEKMMEQGRDILRTVPPDLNPFYKKKVNEYFIEGQTN